MEAFTTIRSAQISRAALWILGEYCEKPTDIQAVMNEIRQSLGEIPIVEDELRKVIFFKVPISCMCTVVWSSEAGGYRICKF